MYLDVIRVNQEKIMKATKSKKEKIKRKINVQATKNLSDNEKSFAQWNEQYTEAIDSVEFGATDKKEGDIEKDLLVDSSLNKRIEEVRYLENLVNRKFVKNPRYNRMINFKNNK